METPIFNWHGDAHAQLGNFWIQRANVGTSSCTGSLIFPSNLSTFRASHHLRLTFGSMLSFPIVWPDRYSGWFGIHGAERELRTWCAHVWTFLPLQGEDWFAFGLFLYELCDKNRHHKRKKNRCFLFRTSNKKKTSRKVLYHTSLSRIWLKLQEPMHKWQSS